MFLIRALSIHFIEIYKYKTIQCLILFLGKRFVLFWIRKASKALPRSKDGAFNCMLQKK